jgi:hypothetical protein
MQPLKTKSLSKPCFLELSWGSFPFYLYYVVYIHARKKAAVELQSLLVMRRPVGRRGEGGGGGGAINELTL